MTSGFLVLVAPQQLEESGDVSLQGQRNQKQRQQGKREMAQRLKTGGASESDASPNGDHIHQLGHGQHMPEQQRPAMTQQQRSRQRRSDRDDDIAPSGGQGKEAGQELALMQLEKNNAGEKAPQVKKRKPVEIATRYPLPEAGADQKSQRKNHGQAGDQDLRQR